MNSRQSSIFDRCDQRPVTHHWPCQICAKPDWCMVLSNPATNQIEADFCNRYEISGRQPDSITASGAGLFIRKSNSHLAPRVPTWPRKTTQPEGTKAKPATLNRVYRHLQSQLTLSDQHRQQLLNRGLTSTQIKQLDYKTLPQTYQQRRQVMREMGTLEIDLRTVPGFYQTKAKATWLVEHKGILIFCHNAEGRIVGAQIRLDEENKGKYRLFSASEKQREPGGVSSGTLVHVAKSETEASIVLITEGFLKADIASLYLNQTVIGIAGVTSYQENELWERLDQLKPKQVVIAFDADKRKNPNVLAAENRLAKLLIGWGYPTLTAEWDEDEGKGIDDLLVAAGSYHLSQSTRHWTSAGCGTRRYAKSPTQTH